MTTAPRRLRAATRPAPPRHPGAALPRPQSRRRGDLEQQADLPLPQTWSVPGPRRYRAPRVPSARGREFWQAEVAPKWRRPSPPGRAAPGRARGLRDRGDLAVVVAPREAGYGGAPGLAASPAELGDLSGGEVGSVPAWRRLCLSLSPGPCGGGRDVPPSERSEPLWPGAGTPKG